ncbi:MAG: DUF1294 domain-containing protein [Candidatus Bathyarchaeota archaeon]|nr:DUF1294 domain-containing protein [Candidatus Bathyarchaeota archaeon]MDI9577689.1 DUF1294 domain-containing protein [Thermoproteota archaeon]NLD66722.1 DUF1294 domain-containing protein [Thermoproteota archaeon]
MFEAIPRYVLILIFIVVNIVGFIVFGFDKLQSKRRGWRVPETRLLALAFLGPFGAWAGMLLFRHKTRRTKFLIVPVLILIQIVVIIYFHMK